MDRISIFENLIIMAAIDGRFTREEIALLSQRAESWGISNSQVQQALAKAVPDKAELTLPANATGRVELLREMILVMAADGELHELEKRLCAIAAAVMDISAEKVNQILDSLL